MKIRAFLKNCEFMPENLAYLETVFPAKAAIPVIQAGQLVGLASQTVRNRLHAGTFPIPTFLVGSRRMCLKLEIAKHLDQITQTEKPKPRRGPKTKSEKIEENHEIG